MKVKYFATIYFTPGSHYMCDPVMKTQKNTSQKQELKEIKAKK